MIIPQPHIFNLLIFLHIFYGMKIASSSKESIRLDGNLRTGGTEYGSEFTAVSGKGASAPNIRGVKAN